MVLANRRMIVVLRLLQRPSLSLYDPENFWILPDAPGAVSANLQRPHSQQPTARTHLNTNTSLPSRPVSPSTKHLLYVLRTEHSAPPTPTVTFRGSETTMPFHTWISTPSCRPSTNQSMSVEGMGHCTLHSRAGQASVVPTLGEAEAHRPLPRQMIWQLKQRDCLSWLRGHARRRRSRSARAQLRAGDWAPAIDRVERSLACTAAAIPKSMTGISRHCSSAATPQIRRATAHASRPRDILELFHPSNLCPSGRNGTSSLCSFLPKFHPTNLQCFGDFVDPASPQLAFSPTGYHPDPDTTDPTDKVPECDTSPPLSCIDLGAYAAACHDRRVLLQPSLADRSTYQKQIPGMRSCCALSVSLS
jgi:hypothetical protein